MRFITTYIFIVLAIGTLVSNNFIDKYVDVGAELIVDNNFQNSGEFWKFEKNMSDVVFNEGILKLSSNDAIKTKSISQLIQMPEKTEKVKLQARMKSENVIHGKNVWNNARLAFVQYDKNNKSIKIAHTVALFSGTFDWKQYSKVFEISPETEHTKVIIQLSHCTGSIFVKDLSLRHVKINPIFKYFRIISLTLWSCFIIFMVSRYIKFKKDFFVTRGILILLLFMIIAGTTISGKNKNEVKKTIHNSIKSSISTITGETSTVIKMVKKVLPFDSSKIGHFCLFALLAIFIILLRPQYSYFNILHEIFIFGGTTEILQIFIDGRSPFIGDFFIDFFGGLFGVLCVLMMKNLNLRLKG
jgi:hypothetical protein